MTRKTFLMMAGAVLLGLVTLTASERAAAAEPPSSFDALRQRVVEMAKAKAAEKPAANIADEAKKRIAELLAELVPFEIERMADDTPPPDGGVMTKFVCIVEWQDEKGEYWRSFCSGDSFGERDLPSWAVTGLAYSVAQDMSK